MGDRVFNGLAHFIKGSIFFLYGVINLGRWLGAFSELGWVSILPLDGFGIWSRSNETSQAWNIKPPRGPGGNLRGWIPSAEMIESTTIFIYGCSNVFLERLAGSGGPWSHGDLEHVSIAFMFIGSGLVSIDVPRGVSTYSLPPVWNAYRIQTHSRSARPLDIHIRHAST